MRNQLYSRSRLFKFILLAALLHLLFVVAIGVRMMHEDREPTLSGSSSNTGRCISWYCDEPHFNFSP